MILFINLALRENYMNQKLSVYLKKGRIASKGALLHQTTLFVKYCLYVLTSFFGKLLFFTYPLFALADIRIAKTVEETGTFEVEKSFEDSNSMKKVWMAMIFIMVKMLVLLSGIILLSGFTLLLVYLGKIIDSMTSFDVNIMIFIFGVPGVLAIMLFILMINLNLGPVIYIIGTYNDIGIADVISKSVSIMAKKGKMKLLLIEIHYLLCFIMYLLISSALLYSIYLVASPTVVIFSGVIFIIIILLKLPKLILSRKIALVSLFNNLTNEEN